MQLKFISLKNLNEKMSNEEIKKSLKKEILTSAAIESSLIVR